MASNLLSLSLSLYQKMQDPYLLAPENLPKGSPFWQGIPEADQRKYPNSPLNAPPDEKHWYNPGSWFGPGGLIGATQRLFSGPPAPLGLPTPAPGTAPQLLPQLPGDTSWGDYGTRANNPANMNYAPWESASGRFGYTDPTTGGGHTMAVYNTMEEGISDTYKLLQRNQEQYGKTLAGALHGWAESSYVGPLAKSLGVDADKPFDISTADPKVVAQMLNEQFRREGRPGSHTATEAQILGGIALARAPPAVVAQAPPAAVPPPAAPLNGTVDVNITHKNPPPDAAVTARGTGAVNVPPPKIEFQDFDKI
jgi:hypothetical protein